MQKRSYNIWVGAKFGQIFKSLPHVNHSWAMEINYTVINCNHYLIYDPLFRPFGLANQKLQHLRRSQIWPNLHITTTRKPLMGNERNIVGVFYLVVWWSLVWVFIFLNLFSKKSCVSCPQDGKTACLQGLPTCVSERPLFSLGNLLFNCSRDFFHQQWWYKGCLFYQGWSDLSKNK